LYELIALKQPFNDRLVFTVPSEIVKGIKPKFPITQDISLVCTTFQIPPAEDKHTIKYYDRMFYKHSLQLTCLFYISKHWHIIDTLTYNTTHLLSSDVQNHLSNFFNFHTQLALIELFDSCTSLIPSERPSIASMKESLKTLLKNHISLARNLVK